jgi:hypothetical protein
LLVAEIQALSEPERQALAGQVLPLLLTTRAGLEEIDRSLEALPDDELDVLIQRARERSGTLGDAAGEYTEGPMGEDSTAYKVEKFGRIVSLTWEVLVNDDLAAFLRIQPALGQAARRREADNV